MPLADFELGPVVARSTQTLVSRAVRWADGRRVLLKQLAQPYPSLIARRRLVFEYGLLEKLRGPGVIEALELDEDGSKPFLVLEDLSTQGLSFDSIRQAMLPVPVEPRSEPFGVAEAASGSLTAAGRGLPIETLLALAIGTARALGRVHAHGVIHKDLRPQNLAFNAQTAELKLIDFQLATELSRENPDIQCSRSLDSRSLEGSLAYISPEQTGRMNRALDYRSDYYSLGVTLFQLATGQLPLNARDPMGWVHVHVSKPPLSAHQVNPEVPIMLSRIVARLLLKDPDARYQSSSGLVRDLERCLDAWLSTGAIPEFELALEDVPESFQVTQRLIGREREVSELVGTFERTSRGRARLLLVSGYSGLGKTSLIREIHKPIVARRGRFVSGKFDQLERNVPYGALIAALHQLLQGLLADSEEHLQLWRERIRSTLGPNLQVMIDLLPELERVTGKAQPVPQLNPGDAQNRFNRAFAELVQLFARADQPLVLFLEDLQWADTSTIELLTDVMLNREIQHLLIIGAYRDNEVSDIHPLRRAIQRIRSQKPESIAELPVPPLSAPGVRDFVAETLRRPATDVAELAELVFERTGGNPFFVTALLEDLQRRQAIFLDAERRTWCFDLEQARAAPVADNVVELLLEKLRMLASAAQAALSVAACLGNQFDLGELAELVERPIQEVANLLWEPAALGIIHPIGDSYRLLQSPMTRALQGVPKLKQILEHQLSQGALQAQEEPSLDPVRYRFRHDRVQQAAYSRISPSERASVHLRIGRKLLAQLAPGALQERLFEVVNHLNAGRSELSTGAERSRLAGLNLEAAGKAEQSAAYGVARNYLEIARALREAEASPHERFDATLRLAECTLMAGQPEQAAVLCRALRNQAPSRVARASVWLLEARILESQALFLESVSAVREGLRVLDVFLPDDPNQIEKGIRKGIEKMQAHLSKIRVEELPCLTDMRDPEQLMAMHLLFQSIPAAIQTHPPLFLLVELTMFDLAVDHGLCPFSAKNFVDCGMIQGGMLGNYDVAYRLGKAAFRVLDRYGAKAIASGVNFVFAAYVSSWRAPHTEALSVFEDCYRLGMETGDVQHVGFGLALRLHRLPHIGHDLSACQEELTTAIQFMERARLPSQRAAVIQTERALARLRDLGQRAADARAADDQATRKVLETRNPQWIYSYGESQLCVSVLLGDFDAAEHYRQLAAPFVSSALGLVSVPEFQLCEVLILTRQRWSLASSTERAEILARVREARERLAIWKESCPSNFAHKYHLACAELSRIEAEPIERVLQHYDLAATSTGDAYVHMRALALELQAAFWFERGQPLLGRALLREAQDLYRQWGATVKVALLDAELSNSRGDEATNFESWLETRSPPSTRSISRSGLMNGSVDLESVVNATLLVSSEMRSDRLYVSLMATLIENAGAQRGSLVLQDAQTGRLTLEAQVEEASASVRVLSLPLEQADGVCAEIVRYVARTLRPLVLDDASEHELFGDDTYVRSRAVRSVVCVPVMHQARLVAVFYAENNAVTRAFPAHRLSVLQLIAAQAAVSLVNASLYASLEKMVEERTRALANKNREVVAMLDGLDHGVFSIDRDLRIQPQFSRRVPELLGTAQVAGLDFMPLLFASAKLSPASLAAMRAALLFSFGNKPELAALNYSHLVQEFWRVEPDGRQRYFEVDWKEVLDDSGLVEKFLVVVRDVSELRRFRAQESQRAWEAEAITQILKCGIEAFRGFCEGVHSLLSDVQGMREAREHDSLVASDATDGLRTEVLLTEVQVDGVIRSLHTVKGNARSFSLHHLVDVTHSVEEALSLAMPNDGSRCLSATQLIDLTAPLAAALRAHEELAERCLGRLWQEHDQPFKSALIEVEKVLDRVEAGRLDIRQALAQIEGLVDRVNSVPLAGIVAQTTRYFASLAAELHKPVPRLDFQDDGTRVPAAVGCVLRDVLVHAFRNALDHGIEDADERRSRGKPDQGCIRIRTERLRDKIRIQVSDDGRGLALDRLRSLGYRDLGSGELRRPELATADGLQCLASDERLAESIFALGVSTKDQASRVSGRGVGMSAIRSFMRECGGDVSLSFTSEPSAGYRPFALVLDLPSH